MASELRELPLTSDPNQTFSSTLNINGENVALSFFLRFSEVAGYWLLDILRNGSPILATLPLVPGSGNSKNLLRQQAYLGIGSMYLVNVSGTSEEYPSSSTLGTDWALLWGDNE